MQLDGFRTFVQRGVVLNIGDVRNLDVTLEIGSLAETITVEATPPPLNTSDSTVGTVITNEQIAALPLNGRDYLQLASLSAGTGPATSQGVIIGGQSGSAVAFLLDGHDNNSQQISTSHSGQKEIVKPSIDAIQEFKVVTNSYSAEYGRSSSGVVSVSLKSGTNSLNGSLYEFFRDDSLNATNYFATTKPADTRHQFGGAVGLPIVRNKTFFFGDAETGRIRREATTLSTLPSASARSGQFSRSIIDPLTRQPFAGNAIPASRMDPAALRILGYVPLPQTGATTNNFIYNSPSDQDQQTWDVRIDQVFNGNHNAYVRVSSQRLENKPNSPLPPDSNGNYVVSGASDVSNNKSIAVVHNAVWSGSVIGSVRVGYNNIDWDEVVPPQDLRGVGIPGVDSSNPGFSQIAITGYRTLGVSNVPNADDSTNLQISGDISLTKGAHTIKTGVQHYQLGIDFLSSQRSSGIFNFNGQYTGDPFADFLLGYGSSSSLSKYAKLNFRSPYTHVFVQDDWRTTERLTLNLGLRYELNYPSVDVNDAHRELRPRHRSGQPAHRARRRGGQRARRACAGGDQLHAVRSAGRLRLPPARRQDGRARRRRHFLRQHDHRRRHVVARDQPAKSRAGRADDGPDDSVDLPEPGLCSRRAIGGQRPRREPRVVGSQQQAADRLPVEPQRPARAARAGCRRGRLLLQPSRQQLAVD